MRIIEADFCPIPGTTLDEPLIVEECFADGYEDGESIIFPKGTKVLSRYKEKKVKSIVMRYSFLLPDGDIYNIIVEQMHPEMEYMCSVKVSIEKTDNLWNLIAKELEDFDPDKDGDFKLCGGHNVDIYIVPEEKKLVFFIGGTPYGEACPLDNEKVFLRALYWNGHSQGTSVVKHFEKIDNFFNKDLNELRKYEFTINDLIFENMGITFDFGSMFKKKELRRIFDRGREAFEFGLLDGAYEALHGIIKKREELLE